MALNEPASRPTSSSWSTSMADSRFWVAATCSAAAVNSPTGLRARPAMNHPARAASATPIPPMASMRIFIPASTEFASSRDRPTCTIPTGCSNPATVKENGAVMTRYSWPSTSAV